MLAIPLGIFTDISIYMLAFGQDLGAWLASFVEM
jgi:hypothetical protein